MSAAILLRVAPARLDEWRRQWHAGRRGPDPRGRPPACVDAETRDAVLDILEHTGPATSVATLRGLFPDLGRNEARTYLAAFRDACRAGLHAQTNALQWMRPGAVWAMDHTQPPRPVDGEYARILLVRDLASHYQLAALPQATATDAGTAALLTALFHEHGAPLVVKSDNHGTLTGPAVRAVLQRWDVQPLVSPPYLPSYNGAIEAGVGQHKTRVHHLATRNNHPERWTCDDVEGARLQGNRLLRPWGAENHTPEERWNTRRRFLPEERNELRRCYDRLFVRYQEEPPEDFWSSGERCPVYRLVGPPGRPPEQLEPWVARFNDRPPPPRPGRARHDAAHDRKSGGNDGTTIGQRQQERVYYDRLRRKSLTDALVALGLLVIRKRRIPLPIKRALHLKIS